MSLLSLLVVDEDKTSAPGPMQIAPAIPSEGGSINDLVNQADLTVVIPTVVVQ